MELRVRAHEELSGDGRASEQLTFAEIQELT